MKKVPQQLKKQLSIQNSACKHLLQTIGDVFDLSKLELNSFKLDFGWVDIRDVFQQVKSILAIRCQLKGIYLRFSIGGKVPYKLFTDQKRLSQILFNLISNSIKFTSNGGIKVYVLNPEEEKNEDREVELKFRVEDSGTGIKAENIKKIFEAFQTFDTNLLNKEGIGLGLTICKSIAEKLGGSIEVQSIQGLGSSFAFSIKTKMKEEEAELDQRSLGEEEGVLEKESGVLGDSLKAQ